jgi:ADP-ribose pyrophosphatase YjhB (NUDIX family)
VPSDLYRHVTALISDFAAEYGEVDLVSRRVECSFDEYEGLLDAFDSFGVVGGAGIRIVRDGCVLLVQYEHVDGWIDPGSGRRPGESYAECAKRGVRRATGVEAAIDGLAQIQIVYLDDPTDRPPAPNPYISFSGSLVRDDVAPGEPITALQWAEEAPEELAYQELSELPLAR